ncbi:MAG: stage III sporulation protein AB [Bacillota bacterium]|nr:MAG: stage III sporulation protein AB [Bacillota bacterium]
MPGCVARPPHQPRGPGAAVSAWLRLAGAVLLVGAGWALGAAAAQRHRRRPQELAALRTAVQVLLTEIDVGLTPLPEALARAGAAVGYPVAALFDAARGALAGGRGITGAEAWRRALDEAAPLLALNAEDWDILAGLGACLGRSDRQDQRRHLQLAAARLDAAERRARQGWEDRSRVAVYLGTLGGALLAVGLL